MHFEHIEVGVGSLRLDLKNYRNLPQQHQKGAQDAIIAEQGKKLLALAKDIIAHGLSPFDLPIVTEVEGEEGHYIVVEGNRRLTTIRLLIAPQQCEGTPIHAGFKKLSKNHADAIPKVLTCAVAPTRDLALLWSDRKHGSGHLGAGTEAWTAMAKARAQRDRGDRVLELDAIDFVMTNDALPASVRESIEGSQFPITTLRRLLTTGELQAAAGFSVVDSEIECSGSQGWTKKVLSDVVSTVALGELDGQPWNERSVDSKEKRKTFADRITSPHGKRAKAKSKWVVKAKPNVASKPTSKSKPSRRKTPTTDQRKNLIDRSFKLSLPAGKVNDIFSELQAKLNVTTHRLAVSVMFRVFLELTVDDLIERADLKAKGGISASGLPLAGKINAALQFMKKNKLLSEGDMKPVQVALSEKNSMLSIDTLHSYVHSPSMNPDPTTLKVSWQNVAPFVRAAWEWQPEAKGNP